MNELYITKDLYFSKVAINRYQKRVYLILKREIKKKVKKEEKESRLWK